MGMSVAFGNEVTFVCRCPEYAQNTVVEVEPSMAQRIKPILKLPASALLHLVQPHFILRSLHGQGQMVLFPVWHLHPKLTPSVTLLTPFLPPQTLSPFPA